MFLDQNLKRIQEDKTRLALCCDLRRGLVDIELRGIEYRARRSLSSIPLWLAIAEQIIGLLRKGNSKRY